MNRVRPSSPRLANIEPYDPKYLPAENLLSANENPHDIDRPMRQAIIKAIRRVPFNRYPDPLANELRGLIAETNGLEPNQVLMGNGGDELLLDVALAWGGNGRKMLNLPPTFSVYETNAVLSGTEVVSIPRKPDFSIDEDAVLERVGEGDIDYVMVASPNNPSGGLAEEEFLLKLLDSTDALVMVDEAYFEFSRRTMRPYLASHQNLLILRTFSKAFSLAGVRVGYLLGDPMVIREIIKVRQPYSVDVISQIVARIIYENRSRFEKEMLSIIDERERMYEAMKTLPSVTVFPSEANYLLFKVKRADELWQYLYDQGILVRNLSHSPGLEQCLRVSVGLEAQNDAFLTALRSFILSKDAE